MKIVNARLEQFRQDPRNANRGSVRGRETLRASLEECGAGRSILVSSDDVLIAGNKTALEAGELGHDDVIVVETDGTQLVAVKRTDLHSDSPEARRLALFDNRSSELSLDWDPAAIDEALKDGLDLSALWTGDELEELLASLEPTSGLIDGADPDAIPESVEPRCNPGDIWRLGRSRLGCLDCTDKAAMSHLVDGATIGAVITDPPYGIEREGITNDDPATLGPLFSGCLAAVPAKNAVVIAFQSPRLFPLWIDALRAAGHHFERALWAYDCRDQTFPWRGWLMCSQIALISSIGKAQWARDPIHHHDCYVVKSGGEQNDSGNHPAVKPIEVISDLVQHTAGDVYDPFGGSGTTLIACEGAGRRCFTAEVEPRYCDITLARWEAATDQSAVRL